ncbi:gamma-butyrobetaine hydroxylase-like domain-containing protein [Gammaproteobacteria bacterium]|nr:gamma-butyrobetaine hydroxylase-like domain-containing protein [Gammaproteobacteria bacterium]
MTTPVLTKVVLHQKQRSLELLFNNDGLYFLPCEYLRVYSPSAEVMGHKEWPPENLVGGKEGVNIDRIEPVGRYALRLVFDDGHDTGLYTWEWLHRLGENQDEYWRLYLDRLIDKGLTRQG